MKTSAYIATSLDGFIARENGDLDWLPGSDGKSSRSEDYGYTDFMKSVDLMIMGRNTFEKVLSFGEWAYDKKVIVLSNKKVQISPNIAGTVSSASDPLAELLDRLKKLGFKHLYIDGGKTIQSFLREGLLDEIIVTQVPILIGQGIRLFENIPADIALQHISTQSYESGFVQSKYQPVK